MAYQTYLSIGSLGFEPHLIVSLYLLVQRLHGWQYCREAAVQR